VDGIISNSWKLGPVAGCYVNGNRVQWRAVM
jgi:hypothetical protein